MNIHESAEDYLERILILHEKMEHVRSIDIANSFNYSRASISRAINNLKDNNYITVDTSGYIELTDLGNSIATKIYERHKVLTSFFKSIGVNEDIALEDACKIEHDLSDETFDALKKLIQK